MMDLVYVYPSTSTHNKYVHFYENDQSVKQCFLDLLIQNVSTFLTALAVITAEAESEQK